MISYYIIAVDHGDKNAPSTYAISAALDVGVEGAPEDLGLSHVVDTRVTGPYPSPVVRGR
jgi:hypothetical protein